MVSEEVTISVFEGNDPLLAVHIDTQDSAGNKTDYDFTAVAEIEFIVKSGVSAPDADALATYTLTGNQITVGAPPTAGNLSIQVSGADTQDQAGTLRYRIDVTKNSKKETVMLGPFVVVNT